MNWILESSWYQNSHVLETIRKVHLMLLTLGEYKVPFSDLYGLRHRLSFWGITALELSATGPLRSKLAISCYCTAPLSKGPREVYLYWLSISEWNLRATNGNFWKMREDISEPSSVFPTWLFSKWPYTWVFGCFFLARFCSVYLQVYWDSFIRKKVELDKESASFFFFFHHWCRPTLPAHLCQCTALYFRHW